MAEIVRLWTVLPLVTPARWADDGAMFAVYCEGHGSQLLLGTDEIVGITNRDAAIEVHWRCDRGHEGTLSIPRPGRVAAHQLHLAA